jgi:hypothetical protein
MLLSVVSVLVVEQSSSEIPEVLMNNLVLLELQMHFGFMDIVLVLSDHHVSAPHVASFRVVRTGIQI